jgi:hypothetical protein
MTHNPVLFFAFIHFLFFNFFTFVFITKLFSIFLKNFPSLDPFLLILAATELS